MDNQKQTRKAFMDSKIELLKAMASLVAVIVYTAADIQEQDKRVRQDRTEESSATTPAAPGITPKSVCGGVGCSADR